MKSNSTYENEQRLIKGIRADDFQAIDLDHDNQPQLSEDTMKANPSDTRQFMNTIVDVDVHPISSYPHSGTITNQTINVNDIENDSKAAKDLENILNSKDESTVEPKLNLVVK